MVYGKAHPQGKDGRSVQRIGYPLSSLGRRKECKNESDLNTKEAITYKGQQQGSEIIMYYCPYPGSLLGPLDLNNTALHKQGELTYSYR